MDNPIATEASGATDIFLGVFFAVIPSRGLNVEDTVKITETLELHGATHCPLDSNERRHVTHMISTTADFPGYHDALDGYIHVVKPSWVEVSIHKNRTANTRQYSPDPRFFLSEVVVICAEDIPDGDKDAIIGGVHAMGGQYSGVLTKLVTHIVAITLHNPTCRTAADKKLKCKPVLPHWFDICLKLGKKIDHTPYLLPDPPIFSKTNSGSLERAALHNPELEGASQLVPLDLPREMTPPASPSLERRELSAFNNRKVMLHEDLSLSDRLESSLSSLIRNGGGQAISSVDDTDLLICYGRGSAEFKAAFRAGKDVGNLNWLYYLINHNTWTSPTTRLLHYPYPNGGVPGFDKFKISVSNYTGEARVYLESLIKAAGGTFTKSMMQENTHLITAHTLSEKCTAAKEWNIKMVNHLWLEESYARCQIQAVTDPRYTTFPEQTNLGEVVGQTQIDREAVKRIYFPRTSLSRHRRDQLEPILPNSNTYRTPSHKSASNGKSLQTPAMLSDSADGGSTASSRAAKDRALNKLHSMALDIALYQKESKRVGGVIYGGRRVTDSDRIIPGKKRSADGDEAGDDNSSYDSEDSEEGSSIVPMKKRKMSNLQTCSEPSIMVLVTGWDARTSPTLKQKARALKINFIDDPTEPFDVLVAPKILRTKKFLGAIAKAPAVVHMKWLTAMNTKNQRLPWIDYVLKDPESERNNDFKLEESLRRAKINKQKGGMLNGWTVFCTRNVHGNFEAHQMIVQANGGQCLLFKGRETEVKRIPKGNHTTHEDKDVEMLDNEKQVLYLISTPKDKELWSKFSALAISQGFEPRICKADWMLRIALSQDVEEWLDEWEWREGDECET